MFRNALKLCLALIIAGLQTPQGGHSSSSCLGQGVSGTGSTDVSNEKPHLRQTNTSDAGVNIVRFVLGIGNTAQN